MTSKALVYHRTWVWMGKTGRLLPAFASTSASCRDTRRMRRIIDRLEITCPPNKTIHGTPDGLSHSHKLQGEEQLMKRE